MAAAIITLAPAIAAALPILLPYAKNVVLWVEHIFGAGNGTSTKMPVAANIVQQLADQLSAAGKIPGVLDPTSIASIVQTAVGILQSAGLLNPASASAIVTASSALLSPSSGSPANANVQTGTSAFLTGNTIRLSGTFTIG